MVLTSQLWREGLYSAYYSVAQQNIQESLHSQSSSELSVWVFRTTLTGRHFCPHLTQKEMWVEITMTFPRANASCGLFLLYQTALQALWVLPKTQNIKELSEYPGRFVFQWILWSGFWKNSSKNKSPESPRQVRMSTTPKGHGPQWWTKGWHRSRCQSSQNQASMGPEGNLIAESRGMRLKQKVCLLRDSDSPFCCVLNPLSRDGAIRY